MINTKTFFYSTLIVSVVVQIITGVLEIITGLVINVNPEYKIIKQLLYLEIIVQFIEGLFYFWLLYNINTVLNVTPKRYIDWSITTPTMLVSLIFYLTYLKYRENKVDTTKMNFYNLAIENKKTILTVLALNWAMLFFGYLGEMKIIPTLCGVILGFVPFLIYYYIIYEKYAVHSKTGINIFWYFFIFWSLYGIVAILPYYLKNALYNILDLFAKNFFGIFLSYILVFKKF